MWRTRNSIQTKKKRKPPLKNLITDFAYETLRIDYFGHTFYLSYTKERLSQEVSRVAERKKYITETVFAPYLIHSFHPKPPLSPWDERPLI